MRLFRLSLLNNIMLCIDAVVIVFKNIPQPRQSEEAVETSVAVAVQTILIIGSRISIPTLLVGLSYGGIQRRCIWEI